MLPEGKLELLELDALELLDDEPDAEAASATAGFDVLDELLDDDELELLVTLLAVLLIVLEAVALEDGAGTLCDTPTEITGSLEELLLELPEEKLDALEADVELPGTVSTTAGCDAPEELDELEELLLEDEELDLVLLDELDDELDELEPDDEDDAPKFKMMPENSGKTNASPAAPPCTGDVGAVFGA